MNPSDHLLVEDAENRRRALELDSFIVEAPAGAGKTELLTQRYLRLLAIVDEPEEVIAITFTNKAAGEMRARIQESLALASEGITPELPHKRITYDLARAALARSVERGWQIEAQTSRLRLTTIDALCAGLVQQMPLLSRFGSQPAVSDQAAQLYDEAARRALALLEGENEFADAIALALAYFDNDVTRLVRLLAEMLARREQWQSLTRLHESSFDPKLIMGAMDDTLTALISEELSRVAAVLDDSWQRRVMPLARFAAANLDGGVLADWAMPLANDDLEGWRALASLLLTQESTPRKQVTIRQGFPPGKEFKAQKEAIVALIEALDEAAVAALVRVRDLPLADRFEDQGHESVVRALVVLMKLAAAELWLIFRERGEVDFSELSTRAISALGDELDPTDLGLRLDYRVRHLLVDEFQDTSPTQIELLQRLTAGWQANDGRTLFAVGDPMQSIYRFRKADVGLFLRVADAGIGAVRLNALRLSRNNRSCPEVVDWINRQFPAVFPSSDDPVRGEIAYREFVATRESLPEAGVSLHPLMVEVEESADALAQREAQQIIALIADEWRADPQRTIAVLVRAKRHLAELVTAIRRQAAGWRFSAIEIEPLADRQAIQDLISLTRALHHRADRVHWLAVLRAPWCGLTLADMHALAADDQRATVWSLMMDEARVLRLSADGQTRLQHARLVLAEALSGQGRQSRRHWVEDAWRKLGGPEYLASSSDADDARAFFDRLDELDAAGRFQLDRLEADMGRLFATPDSAADGRLQLMTIHKAKGLEFDTVILPGLHREVAGRDAPLLAWESFAMADGERLIAAPANRRRVAKGEAPTLYDFLRRMERVRSQNEGVRVLYVAATRAVRKLHLLGAVERDEGGALKAPSAASALGHLWPALAEEFAKALSKDPEYREDLTATFTSSRGAYPQEQFVPQLERLIDPAIPLTWQAPVAAALADDGREATVDPLAAAIGTLTHACLEQIAAAPLAWTAEILEQRKPGFERWLGSRGWSPADARLGAAHVVEMLSLTLASEDGQWVLRQREVGAAEIAVSGLGFNSEVVTRVVDRSFVDNGIRWVIDYKTTQIAEASNSATQKKKLLIAHAERYRRQLESYAALFASEKIPCRIAVFYVAHGILATLDYNRRFADTSAQ